MRSTRHQDSIEEERRHREETGERKNIRADYRPRDAYEDFQEDLQGLGLVMGLRKNQLRNSDTYTYNRGVPEDVEDRLLATIPEDVNEKYNSLSRTEQSFFDKMERVEEGELELQVTFKET